MFWCGRDGQVPQPRLASSHWLGHHISITKLFKATLSVLINPHKNRELGEVLLTLQELSGTSTILPSNNFFNNFFVYFNDRQIFGGKTKNKSFA